MFDQRCDANTFHHLPIVESNVMYLAKVFTVRQSCEWNAARSNASGSNAGLFSRLRICRERTWLLGSRLGPERGFSRFLKVSQGFSRFLQCG